MTMANTDRTTHVHAFMAETTGLTMVGDFELWGYSEAGSLSTAALPAQLVRYVL